MASKRRINVSEIAGGPTHYANAERLGIRRDGSHLPTVTQLGDRLSHEEMSLQKD